MKTKTLLDQHESSKDFIVRLIQLSVPIMLQNLLSSSVSFVDTLMIGLVGEPALAAVGLANQMFFLIVLFYFGVSSGAAIFVAQFWGANDRKKMHQVMGIALVISLLGALFAAMVSLLFPGSIMRIFTNDPIVIAYGMEYLRIVGVSYLFTAVVMIYSAALRSTGDSKTPLFISLFSMSLNVVLNYLLIFGHLGFPRMGVAGAALATTIARFAEVVLLLGRVYGRKTPVAAPFRSLVSFPKPLVKIYFITCLPVILNEMFWSLGMTTYKIAYSRMGIEVIASVNVSEAIQGLFFVVLMGIGNASAIMIGNRIGENNLTLAKIYASRLLKISVLTGIVLGIGLALTSTLLVLPFNLSAEVAQMTTLSLISLGILIPIKAFNMVSIVGILRSGGDTRFSMLAELAGVWFIGVPFAFIGALLLHMPIYYLYLFVGLEEAFKLVLGLMRIRSGKWINRLADTPAPPSVIA
jgi:putative MATE family efflux protein